MRKNRFTDICALTLAVVFVVVIATAARANTTVINNIFDLQNVQNNLAGNYVLGQDIDASITASWNGGAGFLPLGYGLPQDFSGTFDGAGHTIGSLTINRPALSGVGLFGSPGGTIQNLNLTNLNVVGGGAVGGLAGGSYNANIRNVHITGTVTGSGSGIGGIVGNNRGASIVSSSFSGSVIGGQTVGGLAGSNGGSISDSHADALVSGGYAVGGLVGANSGGTINKSYSSGNVVGNIAVGGLVGAMYTNSGPSSGTLSNVYALGSVTGTNSGLGSPADIGGLIGDVFNGTIASVYSAGRVSGGANVGGLVGADYGGNVVSSAYWDTQTSGQVSSGFGTGLTTTQLKSGNLPSGFDPSVWTAAPGQYPTLNPQAVIVQPPVQLPHPAVLADLSNAAYSQTAAGAAAVGQANGFNLLAGPRFTTIGPNTLNGFGVATFQSVGNPNLIVIAVRGTDNQNGANNFALNVVADNSFIYAVANPTLTQDVIDLIGTVASVHNSLRNSFPNAQIVLTGHSLGGALAQIVGSAAGIGVVSFDAPGAKGLFPLNGPGLANTQLAQLSGLQISSPTQQITNYRLYGDQVSLVRIVDQFGNTITISQTIPASAIDTPSLAVNWVSYHSLPTLSAQLGNLCGSPFATQTCATQTAGAPGQNIVGTVVIQGSVLTGLINTGSLISQIGSASWGGITQVAQTYGNLWQQTTQTYTNLGVTATQLLSWDPPPGFGYLFQLQSGSPFIQSLVLPYFGSISGWELQYKDENGWSAPWMAFPPDIFNFTTDVTSLLFFPVDLNGSPIFNPNPFLIGISFQSDGDVNATLKSFNGSAPVPEPSSLLLFGSALAGAAVARLKRRKRSVNAAV